MFYAPNNVIPSKSVDIFSSICVLTGKVFFASCKSSKGLLNTVPLYMSPKITWVRAGIITLAAFV